MIRQQAAYLKEIDNISKKGLSVGLGVRRDNTILENRIARYSSRKTMEKCIFLKKKFKNLQIIDWLNLKKQIKDYDIIINATSLGLINGQDFNFDFTTVRDNLTYIDTIYNPLETKTLKYLKDRDKKVFNGLEMFIYQGQSLFRIKLILKLIRNELNFCYQS